MTTYRWTLWVLWALACVVGGLVLAVTVPNGLGPVSPVGC